MLFITLPFPLFLPYSYRLIDDCMCYNSTSTEARLLWLLNIFHLRVFGRGGLAWVHGPRRTSDKKGNLDVKYCRLNISCWNFSPSVNFNRLNTVQHFYLLAVCCLYSWLGSGLPKSGAYQIQQAFPSEWSTYHFSMKYQYTYRYISTTSFYGYSLINHARCW